MGHTFMETRVEGFPDRLDNGYARPFQNLLQLLENAFEPFDNSVPGMMLPGRKKTHFKVIHHGEQVANDSFAGPAVLFFAITDCPFSEVVEVCLQAKKTVLERLGLR